MKKNILLLLLITIIGCQKNTAVDDKAVDTDAVNAKISGEYIGTYKGILPCADCHGLETEIAINENATFFNKDKIPRQRRQSISEERTFYME